VRLVLNVLVVRVGMNRRHQAALDAETLMQHFGDRSQTVRRAARVRNALHRRRQLVVVHAQHDREVRIVVRRSAQHDPLCAGIEVRIVASLRLGLAGREHARALDHHIHAQVAPGQRRRVTLLEDPDRLAVDVQVLVIAVDRAIEAAMRAVVLQQRGQGLVARQVVDANDLEVLRTSDHVTESQTTDSTKTVDRDANSHGKTPLK